jgi:AraC-like DNA-binding protein
MLNAPLKTIIDPSTRPMAGAIVQDHFDLDCPWHQHDMHQLQYAIEGSIEVEDAQSRYFLPSTLAAWIPAGVIHRTSLHRVRSGSVLFAKDRCDAFDDRIRIVTVPSLMREMIIGAMRWPLDAAQDNTGRAYFAALAALCREWIVTESPLSLPSTIDEKLGAALGFTRANLAAGIDAVCHAIGVSERTLRRRCRGELGMTWDEYRHRARILRAAALLTGTRRPIGQVATEVGFQSQSNFALAFRKLTGRPPRLFRRYNWSGAAD